MKSQTRILCLATFLSVAFSFSSPAQTIHLNAGDIQTGRATKPLTERAIHSTTAGNQLHLVQFDGPIQPEWVENLRESGLQVVDYIPDNAYLVYGDTSAVPSIRSRAKHLQWEGAYLASDKIHPRARSSAAKSRRTLMGEDDLFAVQLVLDEQANAETVARITALAKEPLRRNQVFRHYRNIVVRMDPAEVETIAAQPDVISIAPYVMPRKLDERQDMILAGQMTGNGPSGPGYLAWLAGKGFTQDQFNNSGLVVDVCDSGIDNGSTNANHFGLYVSGNTGLASRVAYARLEGTPNSGSTLQGCDGHGTLNAHIIGGYNDHSGGFPHQDSAGYRYGLGVAPFVKLGSSTIFDSDNFTSPDYEDMISRAYRDGARISSDSWGADTYGGYDIDAQQYDALVRDAQQTGSAVPVAGNQEMTIVFAAGNAGSGAGSVGSPGTAKNVITVGAAENVHSHDIIHGGNNSSGNDGCDTPDTEANSANDIASFSGRGPCSDGRTKPEIVAPGTHITGGVAQQAKSMTGNGNDLSCFDATGVCALPGGGAAGNTNNFFPLGQQWYSTSSGTSHSTPAVSGGAALVWQYFINQGWGEPSPAMVKAFLMNAARYMDGVDANDDLWSNDQGMGMMNLDFAFDGVARILRDQVAADVFTASGQSRAISGLPNDTNHPVRITLTWTDAPGSTSGNSYNNDLNLSVTAGGITYLGNVFNGAFSTSGGSADPKNNTESVFLPAGTTGAVVVVVTAANINSDGIPNVEPVLDQDYALVIYNFDEVEMPVIVGEDATLTAESCGVVGNDAIDPDETVTLDIVLRNAGSADTTNVVATLQPTGGVTFPTGPESYGALLAAGTAVTNAYTFTATGECGGTLTATLTMEDNGLDLGAAVFTFRLGGTSDTVQSKTNTTTIVLNDNASATPYPSSISITNMVGEISKVTATLRGFGHTYPEDIDVLLISPDGDTVSLMSEVGGETSVSGATLTFDDDAASVIGSPILSGTYRPSGTQYDMNPPVPEGPYGDTMANLNGGNPNGTWSLYALDASAEDSGSIAQGWSLSVTASEPLCCGSNKPPVFDPLGDQSIVESNLLSFAVTATDPYDGDPITLTVSNLPTGATFPVTNGNGTFIWEIPAPTGSTAVSFYAEDKDGTTEKGITVTVQPTPFVDSNCTVLISEYVEGSSYNKALEISNPTLDPIDLAAEQYVIQLYMNGASSPSSTINLSGIIPAQDVFVLAGSSADTAILNVSDMTSASLIFNGDDAVVLRSGGESGTVLDCIGQVGTDPGSYWGTPPTATKDQTLRRMASIKQGDTNTTDAFDPATEWDGFAKDTFDGLGFHTSDCTAPPTPTPPLLNPIGNQAVTLSSNLQFQVEATPTDGDAVTLTVSNLPAGAAFYPTNELGTFLWTNASPTGVYSVTFYATDKDGADDETLSITVSEGPVELLAPVIQAASGVQETRFDANWLASSNATGYRLDVSTNENFLTDSGGSGGLQLGESFDSGLAGGYTTGDQTLTSGVWHTTAVLGEVPGDSRGGSGHAARLNDDTPGAALRTPVLNTAGAITFWARELNSGGGTFTLQKSYDTNSWEDVASLAFSGTTYVQYSNEVNDAAATLYLRILNDNQAGHLIVDDLEITSLGGGLPDYVPGFENRDVGAVTTFTVTGLTDNVTYYYRVKAYNATSNSPYSGTTNVLTQGAAGTPPVLNPIGDREVFVSNTLEFAISATPTEGDPVTLTVSNAPAGSMLYPTNEVGTFVWAPASPTGLVIVTFYAADKDGADNESVNLTVHPLPQVGLFTASNGAPASVTFDTVFGETYLMEFTLDLIAPPVIWSEVANDTGTGGTITLQDTNTSTDVKRYYRIRVP